MTARDPEKLGCGHTLGDVATGDEGTSYCRACEEDRKPRWIDLGSGVYARFTSCLHERRSGALIRFGGDINNDPWDEDVCCGGISWCAECPGPTWELHSLDPLHVEPSVKTTSHHGFIRDGKWVPA